MTRDPQRPIDIEDPCPGCLRSDGEHDDDCPAIWSATWDEHRDGAPPIEPEEDG